MSDMAQWQQILNFWFLPADHSGYGKPRTVWFEKDPEFDRVIGQRFGALIQQALAGGLRDWAETTHGALAYIVLLDQFTRNTLRDTPSAFSGDALAFGAARKLVERGADKLLLPVQRTFVYLPFEHAESIQAQELAVTLFTQLNQEAGGFTSSLDYAIRHRDIIARFGRFPHRNSILGRVSTVEEMQFLSQPGSGF